jgi:thioredoxin reductase (NADPH)
MGAGGQMMLTDIIDNYPGFDNGIEGFELSMKMQAGAERFGAKSIYGNVNDVDFSGKIKRIMTDDGEYYLDLDEEAEEKKTEDK